MNIFLYLLGFFIGGIIGLMLFFFALGCREYLQDYRDYKKHIGTEWAPFYKKPKFIDSILFKI